MSWEVANHLSQEFLAIDSDSGMVVGKMVLWRMDQSSTMGGWDQTKLRALQFLPVKNSEATTIALPCDSDDYSEDEAKEKCSASVEKQVMTPNPETVQLSLFNMYADPKAVKKVLKHKKTKLLPKENTSVGKVRGVGVRKQWSIEPQHRFPHHTFMTKVCEKRREQETVDGINPKIRDFSQDPVQSKNQKMVSPPSETLSLQNNTPELIEEASSVEEDDSSSDDDIQIEDLGNVSDIDSEPGRTKNPKTVKVMLYRTNTNANSFQGATVEQVLDGADTSAGCVSCIFCQALIRKEDVEAQQVSNQCRQLRSPASYFPSLPKADPSMQQVNPIAASVKSSSLGRKRGRPKKEHWISTSSKDSE